MKDVVKRKMTFSRNFRNWLAVFLVVASILSGIATYAALTKTSPLGNDPGTVYWLLNLDIVILLMLVALIARRIVGLWSGRKRKIAGSQLHVRLVFTFSVLAAAPAIIMTVFSAVFFHFGVQTWFSQRVQTAIYESQAVAEAYLQEHIQVIRADTLAMANDLERQATYLLANDMAFEKIVETQSRLRNLSEAIVFDRSGRVLARSGLTFSLEFEDISTYTIRQAEEGEVVITTGNNDDRVRALIKLNNYPGVFLFVGRMVDPQVLSHVIATREASQDYEALSERYSELQVTFLIIFIVVALILMLVAIWLGLLLARQLARPISTLIHTADRVRAGDFSARVPDHKSLAEFDYLARSFNRMTKQIQEQQGELIQANRQLDRRRRFTETVLEGVSSGVIGVDRKSIINLANSSAIKLLGEDVLIEKCLIEFIPEIENILEEAHENPQKITQAEIPFVRHDGLRRSLLVRIAIEVIDDQDTGAILTFDDITELQSAQRKAAWADVARRIAHEIKNPLTPIQLSAERLKRKYLAQIKDDPDTFSQCTDTIIKHVEDIGYMVNEFSSFARMPEAILKKGNIAKQINDVVILHTQAQSEVKFVITNLLKPSLETLFDAQQVRQAINNIVQNSIDSIQKSGKEDGKIEILLFGHGNKTAVVICDNGSGFPAGENISDLTEPYVTHKPKGTGLGLAIVKKIMEDHNGELLLQKPAWVDAIDQYNDLGGVTMTLLFSNDVSDG